MPRSELGLYPVEVREDCGELERFVAFLNDDAARRGYTVATYIGCLVEKLDLPERDKQEIGMRLIRAHQKVGDEVRLIYRGQDLL